MEKVYFSPGYDCRDAIVKTIENARKSIDVCVFTISDNRIVDALLKKKDDYLKIRIITDNDKRFDRGSDIAFLARSGIDVKIDLTDAHMHHKFAVIDNEIVITGSYNWTRSAYENNHENIIVSDSDKLVKAFSGEFRRLWGRTEGLDEGSY